MRALAAIAVVAAIVLVGILAYSAIELARILETFAP